MFISLKHLEESPEEFANTLRNKCDYDVDSYYVALNNAVESDALQRDPEKLEQYRALAEVCAREAAKRIPDLSIRQSQRI